MANSATRFCVNVRRGCNPQKKAKNGGSRIRSVQVARLE